MARRVRPEDLTLVPCNCLPGQSIGGSTGTTEWHETPKAAAVAVRHHVERVVAGGTPHWAVHWGGAGGDDQHVVSVVLDGLRWGPGPPR